MKEENRKNRGTVGKTYSPKKKNSRHQNKNVNSCLSQKKNREKKKKKRKKKEPLKKHGKEKAKSRQHEK